jgi:hypothetical protein
MALKTSVPEVDRRLVLLAFAFVVLVAALALMVLGGLGAGDGPVHNLGATAIEYAV